MCRLLVESKIALESRKSFVFCSWRAANNHFLHQSLKEEKKELTVERRYFKL